MENARVFFLWCDYYIGAIAIIAIEAAATAHNFATILFIILLGKRKIGARTENKLGSSRLMRARGQGGRGRGAFGRCAGCCARGSQSKATVAGWSAARRRPSLLRSVTKFPSRNRSS